MLGEDERESMGGSIMLEQEKDPLAKVTGAEANNILKG